VGEQLEVVRDRLFTLAQLQRHHVVLDLNAGSGLLTFEALRRVPEGGVYACTRHLLKLLLYKNRWRHFLSSSVLLC
jgi:precorrin-6B methylase 2